MNLSVNIEKQDLSLSVRIAHQARASGKKDVPDRKITA
jgi:hypothetical protein